MFTMFTILIELFKRLFGLAKEEEAPTPEPVEEPVAAPKKTRKKAAPVSTKRN